MWSKLHECDGDDNLAEDMWLHPRFREWVFSNPIMAQSAANHYRIQGLGVRVPTDKEVNRRGIQGAVARTIRGTVNRELPIDVLLRKLAMRLHVQMTHEGDRVNAICLNVAKPRQAFFWQR